MRQGRGGGHSGNTVKPWLVYHCGGHLSLSIPLLRPRIASEKAGHAGLYPAGDSGPLPQPSRPGMLKLPREQCPSFPPSPSLPSCSVRGEWHGAGEADGWTTGVHSAATLKERKGGEHRRSLNEAIKAVGQSRHKDWSPLPRLTTPPPNPPTLALGGRRRGLKGSPEVKS